jgi:hypothetical protein
VLLWVVAVEGFIFALDVIGQWYLRSRTGAGLLLLLLVVAIGAASLAMRPGSTPK